MRKRIGGGETDLLAIGGTKKNFRQTMKFLAGG
jgi:hypothetical protein